jgi:hypothetical protein
MMPETGARPVTVKQFADDFYKKRDDPSPQFEGYRRAEAELAARHPEGMTDQQLWDELTAPSSKYSKAMLSEFRLVPSAKAPAAAEPQTVPGMGGLSLPSAPRPFAKNLPGFVRPADNC